MDETDLDLFEAEFADELAAMDDMADVGRSPSCKPKRSLNFTTPSSKSGAVNDDSLVEPLSDGDNNNVGAQKIPIETCEPDCRKRKPSGLTELQKTKRARITDMEDDFEVSPPPSPTIPRPPEHRQQNQQDAARDRLMRDYDFERQRVMRRIPMGDFVSVTADEGRRYYMGVQSEMQRLFKAREKFELGESMSLLSVPYEELKQEVLAARRLQLEKATEQTISELETDPPIDETDELTNSMSALWVDRYTPRSYMDLLSDEGTNRTLLHWLKLWDHVVFGHEVKKKDKPKHGLNLKHDKYQKRDFRKEQLDMEMDLDDLGRPFHKIVLLCGPPGLGKTTLAHVLVNHAGYKVTEINASDDRSAETFKNKIDAAIHMQAVLGSDPRPNCLIIDEIDGAPQPAINQLLSLIRGGNDGEQQGKKKQKAPLMRPIICICNDQYVPSLRQLKPLALLLNFPPTIPVKLTCRLVDICQREGLKVDQNTLLALCNKTDNDIRSCINALQFFRGKKCDVSLHDVQSATFAQKDIHKGLFAVWQAIFTRPRQNRRQYVNPYDRSSMSLQEMTRRQNLQNNTSAAARFSTIHGLASTTGEYDKVILGMFDNYLTQNLKDPRMKGINLATSWLCHVDMMNYRIGRTQDYSTYAYIPYAMVVFHLLFAANQINKLNFPHSDNDYRQKLMTSRSLVTSLLEDMTTSVRHYLNVKSAVMDVLPPLMDIIQPSFRPINTQLYSAREKADMNQLIRVMVEYNLTYKQDKTNDGHYTYLLEPQVDQLVRFSGLKQRKQMTYAAKQLVAREIDLERMRRSDGPSVPSAPALRRKVVTDEQTEAFVPNHRKTLQAKQLDEKNLISRDFFGRKIEAGDENQVTALLRKKKKVPTATLR